MARTDVHRPSVLNPEDYEFVEFAHVPPDGEDPRAYAEAQAEATAIIRAHMARTGGTYSTHEHGGNCHICGACARWTVLFYHAPSNTYIRTGRDCADKLDFAYGNFEAFKKNTIKRLEAVAGKRKAQATLEALGLRQACEIAQAPWEAYHEAHPDTARIGWRNTVRDLVDKLVRYGSLSEKQVDFLRSLLERINGWEAEQARRAEETAAAAPAPSGRVTFTGVVVTAKWQESDFGPDTLKLLVKATEGYKVWVTAPGALFSRRHPALTADALRGATVTIKATLTPSADDPKFAFGKRPTLIGAVENGVHA